MTTTAKRTTKKRAGKQDALPLPPSAGKATIDGKEYVVIPADEYAEWYEDQALAALAMERLERQSHLAVPFEEVEARLDRKRGKKGG